MKRPKLLVGVRAGLERVHTIIVREEADGTLRLMGQHRNLEFIREPDQATLVKRVHESILEAINDAQVNQADILAIGIGSPGQIDLDSGIIKFSTRFSLKHVPLVGLLQRHFKCPISLVNIVDAQVMGERRLGIGMRVKDLFYVHVAHYIGASIIIDGKIYLGTNHLRNEFGHTIINPDGPKCECGHHGCLETYSSGLAIDKKLRSLIAQEKKTILADTLAKAPFESNGARIAEAIKQGDTLAIDVVSEAAEIFGIAIANVVNFLNPQMIILSGDIVDEIDLFFETSIASARRRILYADARNMEIVQGRLGTIAGAYGAAIYAKERLEHGESSMSQKLGTPDFIDLSDSQRK